MADIRGKRASVRRDIMGGTRLNSNVVGLGTRGSRSGSIVVRDSGCGAGRRCCRPAAAEEGHGEKRGGGNKEYPRTCQSSWTTTRNTHRQRAYHVNAANADAAPELRQTGPLPQWSETQFAMAMNPANQNSMVSASRPRAAMVPMREAIRGMTTMSKIRINRVHVAVKTRKAASDGASTTVLSLKKWQTVACKCSNPQRMNQQNRRHTVRGRAENNDREERLRDSEAKDGGFTRECHF